MDYPRYQAFFNADRTPVPVKVLRSRNPALIVGFLQEVFKIEQYSPALTNEKLVNSLADFLETWGDADDESLLTNVVMNSSERANKLIGLRFGGCVCALIHTHINDERVGQAAFAQGFRHAVGIFSQHAFDEGRRVGRFF
jgi:hypothetical protein